MHYDWKEQDGGYKVVKVKMDWGGMMHAGLHTLSGIGSLEPKAGSKHKHTQGGKAAQKQASAKRRKVRALGAVRGTVLSFLVILGFVQL